MLRSKFSSHKLSWWCWVLGWYGVQRLVKISQGKFLMSCTRDILLAGSVYQRRSPDRCRCHTPGCFGTLSVRTGVWIGTCRAWTKFEEDPCRFSLRVIAVHLPSRLTLGDREIKQTHDRGRWDKTTYYVTYKKFSAITNVNEHKGAMRVYCSTPTLKDVNAKRCLLAHTFWQSCLASLSVNL